MEITTAIAQKTMPRFSMMGKYFAKTKAVNPSDILKMQNVPCFKKKSKTGIKTPKQDIDLINARINFLKEREK